MEIEFDSPKDSINRAKHGLSLELAADLWWDDAVVRIDDRFHYDEVRMVAIVPKGNRLYHVVFVERGDRYRIISLRHADRPEIETYIRHRYD